jgi:hypothetical protein
MKVRHRSAAKSFAVASPRRMSIRGFITRPIYSDEIAFKIAIAAAIWQWRKKPVQVAAAA